jgi:hypothetical protein
VGEGSSFRRDQRERYAPPLGGANLAHVAEEELLTPEQQVRYGDGVGRYRCARG